MSFMFVYGVNVIADPSQAAAAHFVRLARITRALGALRVSPQRLAISAARGVASR